MVAKKSHSENQALSWGKSQNRIRFRGPWEGDNYNLGVGQAPKKYPASLPCSDSVTFSVASLGKYRKVD